MLRWDTGGGCLGWLCIGVLSAWGITEFVRFIEPLVISLFKWMFS